MIEEERWYYSPGGGQTLGPVSVAAIEAMIQRKELDHRHMVLLEGTVDWKPVSETRFCKVLPPVPPDLPAPATVNNRYVQEVKELAGLLPQLTKRSLSNDFHGQMVTSVEVAQLDTLLGAKADPTITNFLGWRRASLTVAFLLYVVAFVLGLPELVRSFDTPNLPPYFHLISVVSLVVGLLTLFLMASALFSWKHYKRSRSLVQLATVAAFVVPFLIALVPVRWFIPPNDTIGAAGWSGIAGLAYAASLVPLVISVFPAFLRSSMIMKSLVPESTLPGWIALMIAPFNALFFLIGLVVVTQIGLESGVLTFAALTAAPLVVLALVRSLIRPADPEEAAKALATVRRGLLGCYIVAILGAVWMLSNFENATFLGVVTTVCNLLGNIFLFNIVISDYFLGLIRFSFQEEENLRGGPLHASLRSRIEKVSSLTVEERATEDSEQG